MRTFSYFLISFFFCSVSWAGGLPKNAEQLVVSVASNWDATQGNLQWFEKKDGKWIPVSSPVPCLYGRNGLAWGRGISGAQEEGLVKKERDGRAPAGIFEIGKIYGYEAKLPEGAKYPYHQVTEADAWVDDVNSPHYNQHVRVDPKNPPAWFQKQRMRLNDFAYHWLVEIRHNANPPVPGAGSAIFFHIRRGVTKPSAGCTTMARQNLEEMIRWLRKEKNPHYVLLTAGEYQKKWRSWGLPEPGLVKNLSP